MNARLNILFLAHRVPFPPDKGDRIRTFHQLEWLARSHDVHCGCFIESESDRVHAIALRQWCREVVTADWHRPHAKLRALAALPWKAPMTLAAYRDPSFQDQLRRLAIRVPFDVVIAFSACMAPYALSIRASRRVLDLCDADSAKWFDYASSSAFPLSRLYDEEGFRLQAYERECVRRFDATMVITPREQALIDPPGRMRKLHVIGNGVDLPARRPRPAPDLPPVVGFVGAMDYRPNSEGIRWFVRHAWPFVRAAVPDARLLVIGRNPVRAVRRLGGRAGVTVVGEVPDVRPYLARCRVITAPLRIARGLQNKVLEAMAMGRPVVATPSVANAMPVESGRHLLVSNDPAGFAEHVIQLCQDDQLCHRVASAGHRFVAANHSWSEILDRYEVQILGKFHAKHRAAA